MNPIIDWQKETLEWRLPELEKALPEKETQLRTTTTITEEEDKEKGYSLYLEVSGRHY